MTALAGWVRANAPISVERYMAAAAQAYYAARDPFGRGGDFITAPEVSQMFGELIGAWMADVWRRAGGPSRVHVAELGPGRGTLMADLLGAARALPAFADAIDVHFVETSPALRAIQAKRVPAAHWHASIDGIPDDAPLLLVANEFFDALPVRQEVSVEGAWRQRMVDVRAGELVFAPEGGTIRESAPEGADVAATIARRLTRQGGAALIIDYGYWGPREGDTLQAVSAHKPVNPLAAPGEADLSAHVDFAALAHAATGAGARAAPMRSQGAFLTALGIDHRRDRLTRGLDAEAAHAIASAVRRLTAPQAMGELFKVLALYSPDWPEPAGFRR